MRREPELGRAAPRRGPPVSVIIPARNEAADIEAVVRSVLRTTYEPVEVVVVDDRSADATAAIVERLARGDARLRLVRGDELPNGWFGKPWACLQGYRAARGEILVFTDADTRHEPALLEHAVGALLGEPAALVTVASRQRLVTFWERVVMPLIWLPLGLRYHPRVVNRARTPRDVIANGQFIMVRRDAYERVGTHAAVRGEVAEDLALAQAFFLAGERVHFAFAESLIETRMYTGLRHLIEGWSKNVYLGGRRSFLGSPLLQALLPLLLALSVLYWLVPPALVALGLAGVLPSLLPGAAVAWGLGTVFWMLICFGMGIPAGYGLLHPLGAAVMLYVVLRSTLRGRRRVEWRGRVYRRV